MSVIDEVGGCPGSMLRGRMIERWRVGLSGACREEGRICQTEGADPFMSDPE